MTNIYLGTSGFSYREWIGEFYPQGIKGAGMLAYYASHFNAVELNNTFYRLPAAESLESWRDGVGAGFRFAVKANQSLTRGKDFGMSDGRFELFLARIALLGEKLGPVLFQFPPACGDPDQIIAFIRHMELLIPRRFPMTPVIELRNAKLLDTDFFRILREYNLALCYDDAFLNPDKWPDPIDVVYLRLRNSPYRSGFLHNVAKKLIQWSNQGKESYVFFRHEEGATELARKMSSILFNETTLCGKS